MKPTRLFDLIELQLSQFPKSDSINGKVDGKWVSFSTADVLAESNRASLALKRLGVKHGDRVAIISMNRPEWNFIDLGALQLGAVTVPFYPTLADEELVHVINHSGSKILIVEDTKNLRRLDRLKDQLTSLEEIYSIDPMAGRKSWKEQLPSLDDPEIASIDAIKANVKTSDLASIIYTSGTTGTPKGVMLAHSNILSNLLESKTLLPIDSTCRALSFLPLCHIFERSVNYIYMYLGVSIYYAESLATIANDLQDVKPQVFVSVPRLIEKLYGKIVEKGKKLEGLQRKIFDWSLTVAEGYEKGETVSLLKDAELLLARKVVFKKWHQALGGQIRVIISGGAAINPKLMQTFAAADIHILEGYGLTETSAMSTVNRFPKKDQKLGTVGPVVDGVKVKIVHEEGYPKGEGEILIKGGHVMTGYFKDEKATAETMTADGWFKTGDIGRLVDGKFLKITDRKKELFKTSNGKYVAPLSIESRLKENPIIEYVMVVGAGEKHPCVLIVPNFDELKLRHPGIDLSGNKHDLATSEAVRAPFKEWIREVNKQLGHWEQIKAFTLLADEWTVDSGELTPTLKLKRKIIANKHAEKIQALYV